MTGTLKGMRRIVLSMASKHPAPERRAAVGDEQRAGDARYRSRRRDRDGRRRRERDHREDEDERQDDRGADQSGRGDARQRVAREREASRAPQVDDVDERERPVERDVGGGDAARTG